MYDENCPLCGSDSPQHDCAIVLKGRLEAAERERDEAIRQAQTWKQEARTQQSTVQTGYQAVTGATGEPGDWHGPEPFKALAQERDALLAENRLLHKIAYHVRAIDHDAPVAHTPVPVPWFRELTVLTQAAQDAPLTAAEVERVKGLEAENERLRSIIHDAADDLRFEGCPTTADLLLKRAGLEGKIERLEKPDTHTCITCVHLGTSMSEYPCLECGQHYDRSDLWEATLEGGE